MYGNCVLYSGNRNEWQTPYNTLSDKNLKTNITTLDTSLRRLKALRGVYFTWRDDPHDVRQVGLIAQDVLKELPEIVEVVNSEGHLAVKYLEVLPVIVEAIKELADSITAREAEQPNDVLLAGSVEFQELMMNCSCSEEIMKEHRELVAAVELYEMEEQRLLNLLDRLEKNTLHLH
jgi:hypothetical protein